MSSPLPSSLLIWYIVLKKTLPRTVFSFHSLVLGLGDYQYYNNIDIIFEADIDHHIDVFVMLHYHFVKATCSSA